MALRGGTLKLDNTGGNTGAGATTDRLLDWGPISANGGTLSLLGNATNGSSESVGAFTLNAGAATINVTHNGGSSGTVLTLASFARTPGVGASLNFTGSGGTLGTAGANPRIIFTAAPELTNSVIANSTNSSKVGFATVNGTDFASYDNTLGVVAVTTTTVSGTLTTASSQNSLLNASGTIAGGTNINYNTLKIQAGAGATLDFSGTANYNRNAILLAGTDDFTIQNTGGGTGGIGGNDDRFIFVSNASTTLNIAVTLAAANQNLVKSGDGFLALTGSSNQLAFTSGTQKIVAAAGVLRGTTTNLGGGTSAGGALTTIQMRGGVLEISGGGSFTRAIDLAGTTSGGGLTFDEGNPEERGNGGFSAIGGNATVTLVTTIAGSTSANLIWNDGIFLANGYVLTMGSSKADSLLDFTNNIGLDNGIAFNNYFGREIRVADNTGSATDVARLSGVISGSANADLIKTGAGVLELTGTNTYAGNTQILQGTLIATNSAAIGNTTAVILSNTAGATFQLNNNETIGTLSGGGTTGGNVTLQANTLTVGDQRDSTFGGVISGTGAVVKQGTGTLTLTGTNTFSGGTQLAAGGLSTTSTGSLTSASNIVTVLITGNNTTLTNAGSISQTGTGRAIDVSTANLSITVNNSGSINSVSTDAFRVSADSAVSLTNSGTIAVSAGGQAIDWAAITTKANSLTNQATGIITSVGDDAVRPGTNGVVSNAGTITATPTGGANPSGSDGIDVRTFTGIQITNTGTITGRHGIATDGTNISSAITVNNNTNGIIQALNGSGLNIDGVSVNVTANVTNQLGATIKGGLLASATNGDGDGIDIDGLLTLNNYGNILALGAKGIGSDTLPNNAQAVSIGGGTIYNFSTGQIIGSTLLAEAPNGDSTREGEGILADNSSGGNALAVTNITNEGLIQGKTGAAIRLVGTFSNTIDNNAGGIIQGAGTGAAIQTGNGNDTINNRGTITGNNGLAIDLQGGNNTLNIIGGAASITGSINGGTGGTNAMTINPGANNSFSYAGAISNFNSVEVQSGTVTFSGASTYSGTTTISGGKLIINGDNSGASGAVTVANTATLGGSGIIGGTTTINDGGTLSPGASPGTLTQAGSSLVLTNGGNYNWQILNATGAAGTGYDTVNITGSGILDLSALTGATDFNINLWSLISTGPDVNGNAANFNKHTTYQWTLVSTATTIVGFDADEFTINVGANNGASGFSNDISSIGFGPGSFELLLSGDSTDLILRYNAAPVPEPHHVLLICVSALLLGLSIRRRLAARAVA